MSWYYYEDKHEAARRTEQLLAKRRGQGEVLEPVLPTAKRDLSNTFWGQAWNRNLQAYSDYESRLPRGRSYFRAGNVLGLKIEAGKITCVVKGSALYDVCISIKPYPAEKWSSLKERCGGKVGSLVELLAGKLSAEVMREVTDLEQGLFPAPREIKFSCSCPDWADLCKHCAATLYAVGCKLDSDPALFFTLRGVDASELTGGAVAAAGELTTLAALPPERLQALQELDLAAIFGVELAHLEALDGILKPSAISQKSPAAKKASAKQKRAKA